MTAREWRRTIVSLKRKAGIFELKHGLSLVLPNQDNAVFISFVTSSGKSIRSLTRDVLNLSGLKKHERFCFCDAMHKCSGVDLGLLNFVDPKDDFVEPANLSDVVRYDFLAPIEKYFNKKALRRFPVVLPLFASLSDSAVASHAMDLATESTTNFFDAYDKIPTIFFLEKVGIDTPYSEEVTSHLEVYRSLCDEESHFDEVASTFIEAQTHLIEIVSELREAQTNCLTNRVQEALLEAIACIQLLTLQILLEFDLQIFSLTQLFIRKTEDTFKHPPPLEYHPQIQTTCAPNA